MQFLSWLLLPFTLLYATGIALRNVLYKYGVFKRTRFDFPIICIGNLSAGGTGKTPHIEWLIRTLQFEYKLAILSRGYGRKTTGYLAAHSQSTSHEIGDEPMQIVRKFPHVHLAVSENRVFGVPALLGDFDDAQCILMDDGFQHLAIQAGLNIVLTDYNHLFTRDQLLPSGRLREFKSGYQRADIIIVTKCPVELPDTECEHLIAEINPLPHQCIYFSHMQYGQLQTLSGETFQLAHGSSVLALSAIANPSSFINYLTSIYQVKHHFQFNDHHRFTTKDIQNCIDWLDSVNDSQAKIICTEKDAIKISELVGNDSRFLVLPITIGFQKDEAKLVSQIRHYINQELANG